MPNYETADVLEVLGVVVGWRTDEDWKRDLEEPTHPDLYLQWPPTATEEDSRPMSSPREFYVMLKCCKNGDMGYVYATCTCGKWAYWRRGHQECDCSELDWYHSMCKNRVTPVDAVPRDPIDWEAINEWSRRRGEEIEIHRLLTQLRLAQLQAWVLTTSAIKD
ncbi:MAG: hypothetical protein M3M85_03020 [bacterium]|nr:hypothetical protein [bacterium]